MSLLLPLAPIFMLASVLLALARRSDNPSRGACGVFAAVFFLFGVLGLAAQASLASALGMGVLFILVGLPLGSAAVAIWSRLPMGPDLPLNFSLKG